MSLSKKTFATTRPTRRTPWTWGAVRASLAALLSCVCACACAIGCSTQRATPDAPNGEHPVGWADKTSPAFHGTFLAANKFPLSQCQQCHGEDFAGGATGVSCSQGGSCHAQGPPTACTTCHGTNGTPRPATGAHQAHIPYCDTCHQVPTSSEVEKHASADPSTLIHFAGLAVLGGKTPTWDRTAGRCSNTYCHGAVSPQWTDPAQIQCNSCHGAPPDSHARWSRLTTTTSTCTTCHPGPDDPRHHNGVVDVLETVTCTTCHGGNGHPNPPVALDGSTDPTSRGVGAHARHLDALLPDRISRPLACDTCHQVPQTVTEPGHLDTPQTRVRFTFGGAYDTTSATCTVWCHFDKTPGPVWTNATGSARMCDSCHEFPPTKTRKGTPHPSVAGDVATCRLCHLFGPTTHVDGVVEFAP
jgi:predicted CxxxxCH...CXXCH cytochrome family protein